VLVTEGGFYQRRRPAKGSPAGTGSRISGNAAAFLPVKSGIEWPKFGGREGPPRIYALRNKKNTGPNAIIASAQNDGECNT
jgi:hypothetical protein